MRRESGFPETSRRGGVVGRQGRNAFRTLGAIWKSTAAATRQSARGVRANITGAPPTLCQSREYSRRYIGAYRRGNCRGNFEQAWETWPQLETGITDPGYCTMIQISREKLKERLASFAHEIGFDSCRIAACSEPAHATEFREWLREGAHGEMHYMQRGEEKRCDPQKVLPGARSIVTLALNYFQGEQIRQSPRHVGATGRIARYAWGEDYHDVIEAKLSKIDQFLRSFGGQQKYYV